MSDYASQPDPIAWQNEQIAAIWATLRAMAGANNLESAVATGPDGFTVYDPDTGGRAQFFQGRIRFWDDYDTNPDQYGEILVDPGAGINYLRLYPPHSSGTGAENSLTIQGRRPGQVGNAWIYTDGSLVLDAEAVAFLKGSTTTVTADAVVNLGAPKVSIDTPELPIYSLPDTSSGANLHLGMVGGVWTVAYVTSSERYKRDIADVDIDPADVLRWRPRTWRDRAEVDAIGDDAAAQIGFIAEEIHEHNPEFVVLDDQGRPNSLKYDRMHAGHHVVLQDHNARIVALETENATLRSDVADLTARLVALEAK